MSGAPVFLSHPSSLEHDTGGHPEQAARIVAIERELERHDWLGFSRVESPPVELDTLTAIHPASHVEMVRALSARGGGMIDTDTITSAGSYGAALHAAGGAVALVDRLVSGDAPCGFSAHRPPGHHALPTRAMGFCLFNNVSVAARHALDSLGLERVMIVDWDVHHGNGTNDIFRTSSELLFVSIHQSPLYPGTGVASDVGAGEGEGFTVNLPVRPGAGDAEFVSLVEGVAVPLARAFEPQLLLISAGYDAHADDPLANCLVTERGYAAMTAALVALGVPVGVVLEGGYALDALASSVATTMDVLAAGADDDGATGLSDPELAAPAREYFSRWWPALA
ncbi:MAG TPA: histone deacetylase [Solirubrobacteraceae bacterium]|nr:histone deacetylase [Solirubrobacteraceae bacterium]